EEDHLLSTLQILSGTIENRRKDSTQSGPNRRRWPRRRDRVQPRRALSLRGKFRRRQYGYPAARRRYAHEGGQLRFTRASGLDARKHALSQPEEIDMSETQRVAVVTGAAGGIGRAKVRGLLSAGIQVAGADRDREPLEALAASGREQGKAGDLLTIQTDLTNDAATEQITKATRD